MSLPSAPRPVALRFVGLILLTAACTTSGSDPVVGAASTARATVDLGPRPVPVHHLPPPTEHRLSEDAESTNKSRRKAWELERHRAAPDLDWKALERENGARQRKKRNALAAMSAGGSRWTERGSDNQAGRMHVAVPSPTDEQVIYAGSSKGGVWRGKSSGKGWTPLGDNLDGGAHQLAVVPGAAPEDPFVIVRATDGGSVHVTRDEGETWVEPAGLPSNMNRVRRLFSTRDGSETIFLVLRHWESGSNRTKLYRSTDAALSFHKVTGMSSFEGDAWAPRNGGGPIWCIKQTGMHRSLDNGTTWDLVAPLPVAASSAELAGSEAGAPRFYAALHTGSGNALYRSDDAGLSWNHQQDLFDYWNTLNASITDPDLVAWGGVEAHYSEDGGSTFDIVNSWGAYYGDPENKLHADIQGLDVVPSNIAIGEIWYISTDGGLYQSRTQLDIVQNVSLEGLRVSQYYTTHTSEADPSHVIAGSQDQGYQRSGSAPSALSPLRSFNQVISGDYGHAVSGDGSHAFVYSVYPGFVLIHVGETNPSLFQANFPSGEDYSWLPPLAPDPLDREAFFFCATAIHRYERVSSSFTWSPTLWSTTDFGPGYLTGLAWSPLDPNRGYAVTSEGRRYRSLDRGVTWSQASGTGPGPHYFYGTAVLPSALDVDTVYVGGSGYSNPAVWRSTDGGLSFTSHSNGLPSTLVYSLAEAPDGSGRIYAGTETGAYELDPVTGIWSDITANDAPINTYWSAEAVPSEQVIRFGTYGRGIWDYDIHGDCGYEPYGGDLGGANTLVLDTVSDTRIGQDHVFSLDGAAAPGPAFLVWSPIQGLLPLAGGTLLVDPVLNFPFTANVLAGVKTQTTLSIPNAPGLAGGFANWQVVMIDPAQPELLAFSNGLRGTFCP